MKGRSTKHSTTLLRLESVSHSTWRGANEVQVLKAVSLEVRPGDLVAVYGRRGSGKTALLEIAAGLEAPDAGQVFFDGRDLARLSRTELARLHRNEIGWVERGGPRIPDLPARVHVALPLYRSVPYNEAHKRASVTLRRVGAGDYAEHAWGDLPDAARMLVAIAHALVREPRLLIVDDPTAGLDIDDRENLGGLLRSAADRGGVAVLMAVPDMSSMLHAQRRLLLARGQLIAPSRRAQGNVVQFPRDDGRP